MPTLDDAFGGGAARRQVRERSGPGQGAHGKPGQQARDNRTGDGAEAAFALFRYRKFTLPVALLAGAFSGIMMGLNDNIGYNAEWDLSLIHI